MPWLAGQVRTVRLVPGRPASCPGPGSAASTTRTGQVVAALPGRSRSARHRLSAAGGGRRAVVPVTKAAGPVTGHEAAGIIRYGDLTSYAATIQKLAAS